MNYKFYTQLPSLRLSRWVIALILPFMLVDSTQAQPLVACEATAQYVEAFGQPGTSFVGRGDDSNYFISLPYLYAWFRKRDPSIYPDGGSHVSILG